MARAKASEIPTLLRSPLGRKRLIADGHHLLFPLTRLIGRAYRRTALRNCRLVAVVGSYGKTTTSKAAALALGLDPQSVPPTNFRGYLAGSLLRLSPRCRTAVLEVGIDGPNQMQDLARMLLPDAVIVTSIGSEHGRSFKTIEATRREKSLMLESLKGTGVAVLNGDDPNVRWMSGRVRARVLFYGYREDNDVRVKDYRLDWPVGSTARVEIEGAGFELRTGLLGRKLFLAGVAALGLSHALGTPVQEAIERLSAMRPQAGRLQPVALPQGVTLLRDDFKSSLETVQNAIAVLSEIPARRKIVVLGEVSEPPGSTGPVYREVGRQIGTVADRLIVVGRHFQRYATGAKSVGMSREDMFNAGNSYAEAARLLREMVQPGDVVLIKGRDNARLERIALLLQDLPVTCARTFCRGFGPCERCPLLHQDGV